MWPKNIRCGPLDVAATSKFIYFGVGDAADTYGITTIGKVRADTKQHFLAVFNGAGTGNPGKTQLYVDGEDGALGGFVGTIPAATANMAGGTLAVGKGSALPCTQFNQRIYTPPLTPTQARDAYVNNFAKKLLLRETLEDVPVSLVASVGAGARSVRGM